MSDNVNHPDHYTKWPVEVIYLTERESFLRSVPEDTAEMRAHLQGRLDAIYDQVEREVCEAWDAI